jgi:hypothetical protein
MPRTRFAAPTNSAVDRREVQLLGAPGLHDPAGAHHGDAVGEGERLLTVVGDQQDGHAGRAQQGGELGAHLAAQQRVDGVPGLVEEDELGLGRQRAGERDALLLSAAELRGVAAGQVAEADEVERLAGALGATRPRESEADVAEHVEVREQRVVLEDHADAAALRRDEGLRPGDGLPVDGDRARVGALEAGDQPQCRGLAAAAGPQERHELAPTHLERGAVDGLGGPERLGGTVHGEHRWQHLRAS